MPEQVALDLADQSAIAEWVAAQLRHRAAVWSSAIVVGRPGCIDGLPLADDPARAGSLGSEWLRPAEPNSPAARKRRRRT